MRIDVVKIGSLQGCCVGSIRGTSTSVLAEIERDVV